MPSPPPQSLNSLSVCLHLSIFTATNLDQATIQSHLSYCYRCSWPSNSFPTLQPEQSFQNTNVIMSFNSSFISMLEHLMAFHRLKIKATILNMIYKALITRLLPFCPVSFRTLRLLHLQSSRIDSLSIPRSHRAVSHQCALVIPSAKNSVTSPPLPIPLIHFTYLTATHSSHLSSRLLFFNKSWHTFPSSTTVKVPSVPCTSSSVALTNWNYYLFLWLFG